MSALSDLLNRHFDKKYGDQSNRRIADQAGVSRGTIDNYRNGTHPARPSEEVLRAFHDLLGIPMEQLRAAADLPQGEEDPYQPPSEANLLNARQRRAIDELIRSFVATKGNANEDQGTQSTTSDPAVDDKARTGGAPMTVTHLDDHRAPDVDDMLDRVTEEANRRDEAEQELEDPLPYEPELHAARDLPGRSQGEELHRQVEAAGEESQEWPEETS